MYHPLGSRVKVNDGRIGHVGFIDTDDMIRIDFSDGSSIWDYWWNVSASQDIKEPKQYSPKYDITQTYNPRYSRN